LFYLYWNFLGSSLSILPRFLIRERCQVLPACQTCSGGHPCTFLSVRKSVALLRFVAGERWADESSWHLRAGSAVRFTAQPLRWLSTPALLRQTMPYEFATIACRMEMPHDRQQIHDLEILRAQTRYWLRCGRLASSQNESAHPHRAAHHLSRGTRVIHLADAGATTGAIVRTIGLSGPGIMFAAVALERKLVISAGRWRGFEPERLGDS